MTYIFFLFAYLHGADQFFNILTAYKNFNLGTFPYCRNSSIFPIMINGGKLRTENDPYNEACDDGNFDVQLKRHATGFNLSLFSTIGCILSRKRPLE